MTSPRGYALIAVLWLIALLSIMTASYNASARVESKLLAHDVYRARAEALAEAGIWLAAHEHFHADAATRAAHAEHTIEYRDTTIEVTIADIAGRINLNTAPAELLDSLLAYAGAAPAERPALVDAILDWRDTDDTALPHGAEDPEYATAGAMHGSKDAPFATVDELRRVLGMTDTLYRRAAPLLTVYGDERRVFVEAATDEVLSALPGADERAVDEVLRRRADGNAGPLVQPAAFDSRFLQRRGSDIYVITSTARAGDVTAQLSATVRYTRDRSEPLQLLQFGRAR